MENIVPKLQPSKRMVLDLEIKHLSSLSYRLRLEEVSGLRDCRSLSADFSVFLLIPRSLEHNVLPFLRSGSCYPWTYYFLVFSLNKCFKICASHFHM